ncbi:hypothetical protein [Leptodesmis sichuanensis]|uniref:hypothetical protein n=1 Tax=Leptodesmis sichuanensis TaxID=2906798 RepID=UPI001F1C223C|nr:hypothetical protein [Leptodesmis sichuanensis]UIE36437.1 hypothetical protein KIK02_15400 [Leptodesmis sichuanensis A121]
MAKAKILKPGETYTFRRYFELRFPPAAILQELGASLTIAEIAAPKGSGRGFAPSGWNAELLGDFPKS